MVISNVSDANRLSFVTIAMTPQALQYFHREMLRANIFGPIISLFVFFFLLLFQLTQVVKGELHLLNEEQTQPELCSFTKG